MKKSSLWYALWHHDDRGHLSYARWFLHIYSITDDIQLHQCVIHYESHCGS